MDANVLHRVIDNLNSLFVPSVLVSNTLNNTNASASSSLKSFVNAFFYNHWHRLSAHQKHKFIFYICASVTTLYIVAPSIHPFNFLSDSRSSTDKMFARSRPDKYTTGLINMDIDCFANSTLQSLAALPGLNEYLNEIGTTVYNNPDIMSKFHPPELTLHAALCQILSDLQKIVYKSKTLSVWDFLNVMEKIFKSKISKSQHDAHELLQLILETLFNENLQLCKYSIRSGLDKLIEIPPLPFKSLLLNQLQCTVCGGSSSLNFSPMMILTLPVPQEPTIHLSKLITESEHEFIEGYSCLKCRINAIINMETQSRTISDENLALLKDLQRNSKLLINDDLDPEIDRLINNYKNSNGFDIKSVKTTINKRNDIAKAPKVLPIHLSRSIFSNTQELRNSCQVLFPEELVLKIDEPLSEKLQKMEDEKIMGDFDRQDLERIEEEDQDSQAQSSAKPSILADFDEKQEDAFYEDVGQNSDVDEDTHSDSESFVERRDEEENFVDQEEDDAENEDAIIDDEDDEENNNNKSVASSPIFKKGFETTPSTSVSTYNNHEKINNIDIGPDSSVDPLADGDGSTMDPANAPAAKSNKMVHESKHRYRLKSMIRHLGTHHAGHYECYRHKPIFYKVDSDHYDVAFPFLINFETQDDDEDASSRAGTESAISDSQQTDGDSAPVTRSSRSSSFRQSRSLSISRVSREGSITALTAPPDDLVHSQSLSRSGSKKKPSGRRFSRRLSSFLRPGADNTSDGGADSLADQAADMTLNDTSPMLSAALPKRKKRLGSFVKYPFWRISDSKVVEVKAADVMSDNKAVYMLFYERVD